jgi:hypothetical protein
MITRNALDEYVDKKRHNRAANKHRKERSDTIGASEIGQCQRKVWYLKKGDINLDEEDNWGAAQRGNTFERNFWVPAMRAKYGDKLLFSGTQQKRWVLGNLSATPDGILVKQPKNVIADLFVPDIGPSRCLVVDCKTIDPRIKLSEAKPEHVFQIQTQLGLLRELSEYKPDYGVIAYTNASFYDDVVEFALKFDPDVYATAKRRADRIMHATSAEALRPEGWISGGKECDYCQYAKLCIALRRNVPDVDAGKKLDPQVLAELEDLVREERKWASAADAAEAEQKALQHDIKEILRAQDLAIVKQGCIEVVWSAVVGRPSYDWPGIRAAARAVGLDLEKYTRVGEPTDRLTVKLKAKRG